MPQMEIVEGQAVGSKLLALQIKSGPNLLANPPRLRPAWSELATTVMAWRWAFAWWRGDERL